MRCQVKTPSAEIARLASFLDAFDQQNVAEQS